MSNKIWIIPFYLFCIFSFLSVLQSKISGQEQQHEVRIAVLPFIDTNAAAKSEGNGEAIAGMLTTELINGRLFQVVERSEITRILDEIGMGQTGVVDTKTAKEIGKIYGVDLLVLGSVARFGTRIEADIRLVDTQTGSALHAENAASRSESEIRTMVVNLARKMEQRCTSKTTLALQILSVPDGANIFLDNKMASMTPATFNLAPGTYMVRLEKNGFQPREQSVSLTTDDQTVNARLAAVETHASSMPTETAPNPTPKSNKKWFLIGGAAGATGILAYILLRPKENPNSEVNIKVTISN